MKIAGVDEAGRGPLAGPVVAAACVFAENYQNDQIKDSKKLSPKKREKLYELIQTEALDWSIVAVGPRRIDQLNIRQATKLAMELAVKKISADLVLIDGNMAIDTNMNQKTVIGGDSLHVHISAASILAKVWRDKLMSTLSEKYKGYSFETHAGYPTKLHKQALQRLGPCRVHRKTFRGVRELLDSSC